MMAKAISTSTNAVGHGANGAAWSLPAGMPPIQRCKMAHQKAHEELGTLCGVDKAEEVQADRLAAMRLISLTELADAASIARTPREIATKLGVTVAALKTRERNLHPSERAFVTRHIKGSVARSRER